MEFVEVMKQWRRMCKDRSCESCNLKGSCDIDPDSRTDDDIRKIDTKVKIWAAENPEPVYPTWWTWLINEGVIEKGSTYTGAFDQLKMKSIPADMAEKLGIEPKEG